MILFVYIIDGIGAFKNCKDDIWLIGPQSVNKKAAFQIFPLLALSVEKKCHLVIMDLNVR